MSYEIRVGKNAADNWRIIEEAEEDDLWLHVRDAPSAHVILRYPHTRKEMQVCDYEAPHIKECCDILRRLRSHRRAGRVVVTATLVKNLVRRGHVGTVRFRDPTACVDYA